MYRGPLMTNICQVSKIEVFLSSFVLVFTNGTTFPEEIFSRTCTLRGKNDVQVTCYDSYICYVCKIDVLLSSFLSVFTTGTTFSEEILL